MTFVVAEEKMPHLSVAYLCELLEHIQKTTNVQILPIYFEQATDLSSSFPDLLIAKRENPTAFCISSGLGILNIFKLATGQTTSLCV